MYTQNYSAISGKLVGVIRDDGAAIPINPDNRDWVAFLVWNTSQSSPLDMSDRTPMNQNINYAALRAEISLSGYAGLTDQQVADSLNTRNQKLPAKIADMMAYLHRTASPSGAPIWLVVEDGSTLATDAGVKTACRMVVEVGRARYDTVDVSLPIVKAMLDALVAAGMMVQADEDYLIGLGVTASRAEVLFVVGVSVTAGDVSLAR